MNEGTRLLLGLLLSSSIGYLAYRRGSLSPSGVLGAIITGTLIFGLGGWSWGLLLIGFFVSSSALSRYKEQYKAAVATDKFSKGSRRDLEQVFANGGTATLFAIAATFLPEQRDLLFSAFVGALATVNADTWATELGVLARTAPRLITSGKTVTHGTSGGITAQGTGAALLGAAFIGTFAVLLRTGETAFGLAPNTNLLHFIPAALLGGVGGALFDSLLGATVQAMFACNVCGKETEKTIHHDVPSHFVRGWRWMDNDVVNFLSSLAGAVLSVLVSTLLR